MEQIVQISVIFISNKSITIEIKDSNHVSLISNISAKTWSNWTSRGCSENVTTWLYTIVFFFTYEELQNDQSDARLYVTFTNHSDFESPHKYNSAQPSSQHQDQQIPKLSLVLMIDQNLKELLNKTKYQFLVGGKEYN